MNINDVLIDNEANLVFLSIVQKEDHSIKSSYDNGEWQDTLLSESGLYEFIEEWDEVIICYLKKIA